MTVKQRFLGLSGREKTITVAAVVGIVGAFLPWASVFGVSVVGIEGDGQITLAVCLISLALTAWRTRRTRARPGRVRFYVPQVVLGAVVLFVGLADWTRFASVGIYLTTAAGAAIVGAALHGLAQPASAGPSLEPASGEE